MMVFNRNLLFQGCIFRCHVSFREGIIFHQPGFSWSKVISLPKCYLLVVWCCELIWSASSHPASDTQPWELTYPFANALLNQVLPSDLFGEFKWPFWGLKWPPFHLSKGLEDDNFPILQVGYVSSLAGTRKTGRNKTNTPWSTNTWHSWTEKDVCQHVSDPPPQQKVSETSENHCSNCMGIIHSLLIFKGNM